MKTAGSFLMYRIEITTPTPYESILKESTAETWTETFETIKTYNNYNLENININVYKQTNPDDLDCWEFVDRFDNIEKSASMFDNIPKKKSKKIIKTAATAAGMIAAFPVMVTLELIKKS